MLRVVVSWAKTVDVVRSVEQKYTAHSQYVGYGVRNAVFGCASIAKEITTGSTIPIGRPVPAQNQNIL